MATLYIRHSWNNEKFPRFFYCFTKETPKFNINTHDFTKKEKKDQEHQFIRLYFHTSDLLIKRSRCEKLASLLVALSIFPFYIPFLFPFDRSVNWLFNNVLKKKDTFSLFPFAFVSFYFLYFFSEKFFPVSLFAFCIDGGLVGLVKRRSVSKRAVFEWKYRKRRGISNRFESNQLTTSKYTLLYSIDKHSPILTPCAGFRTASD